MYRRVAQSVSKNAKQISVPLLQMLLFIVLLNDTRCFLSRIMFQNPDNKSRNICNSTEVVHLLETFKGWIVTSVTSVKDHTQVGVLQQTDWDHHFKIVKPIYNNQTTYCLATLCISTLYAFDTCVTSVNISNKLTELKVVQALSSSVRQFFISCVRKIAQCQVKCQRYFFKPLKFCRSKTISFTPDVCCVAPSFEEYVPRLASFRSIFLAPGLASISYIQLAQAGFKYEGRQPYIKCVECGRESSIFSFVRDENCMSDPGTAKFHANGCSFISAGLESSVSSRGSEIASDENCSLTSDSTTGRRVSRIETQVQQGINLSKDDPTKQFDKHIDGSSEYAIPTQISFSGECYRELTVATALHNGSSKINGQKETTPHKVLTVQNRKQEKINLLQKENRKLSEKLVCKVCNTGQVRELFLPCGELLACHECSKQQIHCPSCNVKILATATVYFS